MLTVNSVIVTTSTNRQCGWVLWGVGIGCIMYSHELINQRAEKPQVSSSNTANRLAAAILLAILASIQSSDKSIFELE